MTRDRRSADLDADIARLYTLPLAEFTPARNALAARLRKDGDKESSARVQELAKPSVSAWAVNALFAQEGPRMEALLAAGEKARCALGEALRRGAAETLRGALEEERKLRDDLRGRAVDLLAQQGSAPGRAIVDRLTVNLESLALSPAAAEVARRGWLDRDLDPPGFEVLAGLQLGAARPERRGLRLAPPPPPERRKEEAVARETREDAFTVARRRREDAAREQRATAEQQKRERLLRVQETVARAAEESARLDAEAQRAATEAKALLRAADEARRRSEAAQKAADLAQARAESAAARLAEARAKLKELSG